MLKRFLPSLFRTLVLLIVGFSVFVVSLYSIEGYHGAGRASDIKGVSILLPKREMAARLISRFPQDDRESGGAVILPECHFAPFNIFPQKVFTLRKAGRLPDVALLPMWVCSRFSEQGLFRKFPVKSTRKLLSIIGNFSEGMEQSVFPAFTGNVYVRVDRDFLKSSGLESVFPSSGIIEIAQFCDLLIYLKQKGLDWEVLPGLLESPYLMSLLLSYSKGTPAFDRLQNILRDYSYGIGSLQGRRNGRMLLGIGECRQRAQEKEYVICNFVSATKPVREILCFSAFRCTQPCYSDMQIAQALATLFKDRKFNKLNQLGLTIPSKEDFLKAFSQYPIDTGGYYDYSVVLAKYVKYGKVPPGFSDFVLGKKRSNK